VEAIVSKSRNRFWIGGLTAFALVAAACNGNGNGNGDEQAGSLTVMSAFTGEEADAFRETFADFVEETGIDLDYEPADGFETVIQTRVQGGNPPDIALFPQPGLLMDIVEESEPTPLEEFMDMEQLEAQMAQGFLDAARDDEGNTYAVPMRLANKSLLWYPVPQFEEAGYEVPETQEELQELEDQILADGATPWCLGMESGDATGWVGTDWVEEFVLRLHGPDVYDAWVDGEQEFSSPEVREAFEEFERVWTKDGNVVGGTDGLLNIPFGESPNTFFDDEPDCYLHRQGNFVTGFFPEDVQEDLDGNVAVAFFPPFEGEESPILAGGDLALMINDTPEARQFMEYLADPSYGQEWAAQGGWLSPNVEFDPSVYPDEVHRQMHQTAVEADVIRFDASDMMPGAVGTGSFWTGIVDWVSGRDDLDSALERMDSSWPGR
jgi:alpha-glucoside transport system substrate-binding protein